MAIIDIETLAPRRDYDIHLLGPILPSDIESMFKSVGLPCVSSHSMITELVTAAVISGNLTVHINSPGGSVVGALQIVDAIKQLQSNGVKINTFIDGLAASGASLVAIQGQVSTMTPDSAFYVHRVHSPLGYYSDQLQHIAGSMARNKPIDLPPKRPRYFPIGTPMRLWQDYFTTRIKDFRSKAVWKDCEHSRQMRQAVKSTLLVRLHEVQWNSEFLLAQLALEVLWQAVTTSPEHTPTLYQHLRVLYGELRQRCRRVCDKGD